MTGLLVTTQIEEGIAVTDYGFPLLFKQGFQLGHVLDDDGHRDFPASHGSQQFIKVIRQCHICKLVHDEMYMDRQSATMDLVCLIVKLLE